MTEDVPVSICLKHIEQLATAYRTDSDASSRLAEISSIKQEILSCNWCRWAKKDEKPEVLNPRGIPFWIPITQVEFRTSGSMDHASMGRKRRKILQNQGLYPFEPLTNELTRKLKDIGDTSPGHTPGRAILKNGIEIPRIVFLSEEPAISHGAFWMHFVRPSQLEDLGPSPEAFPAKIRRSMPGETSMSSLEFVLKMSDGGKIPGWYGGYNDFVQLPHPYRVDDIVAWDAGRGLAREADKALIEPEFVYCVYGTSK